MKIQDAINILNLTGAINAATIKAAYRRASAIYHPDREHGSTEMMQAVNAARDALTGYTREERYEAEETYEPTSNYGEELARAIQTALNLDGLTLELCGNWLWIAGDTKTHKAALKAAGFRWAPKKQEWYFRPAEWKSASRGTWDKEKIREHHGSTTIKRGPRRAAIK